MLTFEEGGYGDFVRGVEGDAVGLAGCGRFVGEAEAREAGEVGLLEGRVRRDGRRCRR